MSKVSIIGQGYVGFPLAMAALNAGHVVVGVDSNKSRVSELNSEELISAHLLSDFQNNYKATVDVSEIRDSEIVILCLPTPLDEEGRPDHTILIDAAKSLTHYVSPGAMLINESTVEPGFNREVLAQIFSESQFDLAFSPERIDPGNVTWRLENTPKLVAGLSLTAATRAFNFYKTFNENVILCSSLEIAETAKLLENSFRLINISFINEFNRFCREIGIDIFEVIQAAATKPFGFTAFSPSIGIGGHCIPIDPKYLSEKSKRLGVPFTSIENALKINGENPFYYADQAEKLLNGLSGKQILLVGLAYKPGVVDLRESASVILLNELRRRGAKVLWHDKLIREWNSESPTPITGFYDLVIISSKPSQADLVNLEAKFVWDLSGPKT
jgi:UDP-N-acetyl-D-glucosamine dehydrogenase